MGERKVLNFYVAPDFDASIIPRQKRDRSKLIEVRTMLPFSMRCNTCGEYMYRGKKFNSRKEDMPGEDYMGIRKFRFYIKCSVCSAEITFCTDPKNSDYECESGALRNFEMWRENDKIVEEDEKVRQEEDKIDAMKALENRTLDSKVEMDVLDALDEIQAINQRHERVDTNAVLDSLFERTAASAVDRTILASGVTQADEELIKSIKFKNAVNMNEMTPEIVEDNDAFTDSSSSKVDGVALSIINQMQKRNAEISTKQSGIAVVKIIPKRKAKIPDKSEAIDCVEPGKKQKVVAVVAPVEVKQVVGLGALMAYGSDDSD
jgi:Saf4/Yju2 protein